MTSALRTMLGTQKGFIVIIIYSGISEISQFQIFCHCSHISWKNPKMPANYTFGLPFSLSGRLLKQWGEENFLQSSLALNHVAPIVVIIKLPPALCIQLPRLLYHFFFFILRDIFLWHSHLHALATISPRSLFASLSFLLLPPLSPFLSHPLSLFLFPYFFPTLPFSLLPLLPEVFGFPGLLQALCHFLSNSPVLSYIQVLSRQMLTSPPCLLFKYSFMFSMSLSSSPSAMLCLQFFLKSFLYFPGQIDK